MNKAKETDKQPRTAEQDMNDALADFGFGIIAMIDKQNGNDKLEKLVKKYR